MSCIKCSVPLCALGASPATSPRNAAIASSTHGAPAPGSSAGEATKRKDHATGQQAQLAPSVGFVKPVLLQSVHLGWYWQTDVQKDVFPPNTHSMHNCTVYKKHPLKRFSYKVKAHYEDFLAYVAVYSSSNPIMLILNRPPPNSEMNFTEH